jgi:predicted O-methyltransferase YrrM
MHAKKDALPVNMATEEFGQLLAVLHALAPERCLEWGSGGSTRAVLEHCPFVKRYVSIEHDPLWYQRVRSGVTDPRLELHLVPPAESVPAQSLLNLKRRRWNARAEIERPLFAAYVDWPATLNVLFDLVFVDGRARRFCLRAGWMLLRPGGVLLLHDAQRRPYHDVLFSLGPPLLLEPWRQGQMALLRKPAAADRARHAQS